MEHPARETVTILHPGASTEDEYGQLTPGTATESSVDCLVAPGDSEEYLTRQSSVTADFTIYAPVGTPVTSAAQVRVRGDVYAVDGQPAVWHDAGVVIRVTRAIQEVG